MLHFADRAYAMHYSMSHFQGFLVIEKRINWYY